MTSFHEVVSDLAVVVDLAVQDDGDGSVLVEDRLVAGGQVDDPEALNAETDPGVDEETARIRPAVLDHRAHPREQLLVDSRPDRDLTRNAAHA